MPQAPAPAPRTRSRRPAVSATSCLLEFTTLEPGQTIYHMGSGTIAIYKGPRFSDSSNRWEEDFTGPDGNTFQGHIAEWCGLLRPNSAVYKVRHTDPARLRTLMQDLRLVPAVILQGRSREHPRRNAERV